VSPSPPPKRDGEDPAAAAIARGRAEFVDVVGTEISAIWRNVTRLGGQCVAALTLWDEPRSMDDLAEELGRSKSNVFANLRALEALGIVRRVRVVGSAKDHFELTGSYPDVLVVAFARHLGRTLEDKSRDLADIAARLEADRASPESAALTGRMRRVAETYGAAGALIDGLLPRAGAPSDLASILARVTPGLIKRVVALLRSPAPGRPLRPGSDDLA
jgi:DNA-binding transcriptional regulator GbsR (MarR family)